MIVADYGRDRTKSTASLLQPLATMNCAVGVDYVAGNDGLCGIVRTNGSPSLHESRGEGGRGGRLVQVSSPKRSVRVWGTNIGSKLYQLQLAEYPVAKFSCLIWMYRSL